MSTITQAPARAAARTRTRYEDSFARRQAISPGAWIVLGVILAVAWILRAQDFNFSTAYMDESIYVVYGRMFLARHFEPPLDTPLQWSFGWYLWPSMAALADRIGGLAALRELAAGLGMVTIVAVWGFSRRVFSLTAGMGAAAVMAVLAPAVLVSRIATRDSGTICFFALGMWAFAAAWRLNRKRYWTLAALCLFAAFLCKYLVAIFFPALVIMAIWRRKASALFFIIALSGACLFYGVLYFNDLEHLLRYGAAYRSLRAPRGEAWGIYFTQRWDFWLLAAVSLPALFTRKFRSGSLLLWAGGLLMLLFQWWSRADYDYWKHANYVFIFLVPVAVAGVLSAVDWLARTEFGRVMFASCGVVCLAFAVGWLGSVRSTDDFIFWPNVDPILAYFEGRLQPGDRVLVDDTVMRYYLGPPLHQDQIVDPMYFHYGESSGEPAYKAAVRDGAFDYVVLNGGMGEEAQRMDAAIQPLPALYKLQLEAVDATLGHRIEVYAKSAQDNPDPGGPGIRLISPASGSVVSTAGDAAFTAGGVTMGAQAGWYAHIDVFTNRWYEQGSRIPIASDGAFHQTIYLGGQGAQQCYHLVRARLLDQDGKLRASTLNYAIARANPDGSPPACH